MHGLQWPSLEDQVFVCKPEHFFPEASLYDFVDAFAAQILNKESSTDRFDTA